MNLKILTATFSLLLGVPLFAHAGEKFPFPVSASSKVLGDESVPAMTGSKNSRRYAFGCDFS